MILKIDYQNLFIFIGVAIFLIALWGLIGYYILGPLYFIMSFLFYLALFLLGMLFRLPNSLFIPFTYISVFCSDTICRAFMGSDKGTYNILFILLIFYILELMVLTLKKLSMDAKDYGWSTKQRRQNIGIALLLPSIALVVYYIIIRQVFVFE